MQGQLSIEDLSVRYGDVSVVKNISLDVARGEFLTLLGPSGCGKTTTLRCIAGLEPCSGGTIRIGNRTVAGPGLDVPPERRNINMVFQNYAIWPHMTVTQNVSFGLSHMNGGREEIARRAEKALDLVGLKAFGSRYGTELSGGQQQRVAVARAVVTEPELLLFDEPLSNLDAILRERMRVELRELHDRLGKTAIYVTHDQSEAMSMSDRVVLMNDGRIVQQGTPREVFEQPRTLFAAEFLGMTNVWPARAGETLPSGRHVAVLDGDGRILLSEAPATTGRAKPVAVGIRAERVAMAADDGAGEGDNHWKGTVRRATYLGNSMRYAVDVGSRLVNVETHSKFGFTAGDAVIVTIDPAAVVWLEADAAAG